MSSSTTYYYRVRAFDGSLASNYTSSASATTPAFGPAPSVVAGPDVSPGLSAGKGRRGSKLSHTVQKNPFSVHLHKSFVTQELQRPFFSFGRAN